MLRVVILYRCTQQRCPAIIPVDQLLTDHDLNCCVEGFKTGYQYVKLFFY